MLESLENFQIGCMHDRNVLSQLVRVNILRCGDGVILRDQSPSYHDIQVVNAKRSFLQIREMLQYIRFRFYIEYTMFTSVTLSTIDT
mgnify:CR=1 FL=1